MTGSCSIHILKAERRCQYEIRSKSSPISCGSPECISGTDAEMDAEPVGVCAGTAHAVYFRLRSLYSLLSGVAAVFDLAGGYQVGNGKFIEFSIAYCPVIESLESEYFRQVLVHEAIGHGFGKLEDEYARVV